MRSDQGTSSANGVFDLGCNIANSISGQWTREALCLQNVDYIL